ncbi:peptidase S24 [Pseudomonas sp. PA15(2017)]|nr:peptidase S24 [Pseudomonas sp. PA15(2017)]
MDYPAGHGDGYLNVNSDDKNAYGLRVVGSSMHPRIKDGEYVLIEPNHAYLNGDEVLVQTLDGQSMIKEFIYHRDGQYRFDSVNSGFPPLIIDQTKISKIHYVAGILKASRHIPEPV